MIPQDELAEVLRHPVTADALVRKHGDTAVLAAAYAEGIAPYLAWLLPRAGSLGHLLTDVRRAAVLDEAVRHPAAIDVCNALGEAGIPPMVFKGGAWAHTIYPEPWCRPRLDLDVLVPRRDRERACAILRAAGFEAAGRIPGTYVNHQEAFTAVLASGITLTVDLHWEVSNRAVIAAALPGEALLSRAEPAPCAGRHARQPDVVDSLLIACLHPLAHHQEFVRLIWWLDVALLARDFPAGRLEELHTRAASAGVAGLVGTSLDEARRLCEPQSSGPSSVAFIQSLQRGRDTEASMVLLSPSRGLLADVWNDLRALPTHRARLALVREHVWPPADFMLAQHGTRQRWLLPVLYIWRLLTGGTRWIRDWLISRRAG